jgi:4-hydroxythreonine-4-phosphate dehydrogenase
MLCLKKKVQGIVTAPVAKHTMNNAGFKHPGQTEMLADLSHASNVAMMLIAHNFRVGLATVHLPLKNVAKHLFQQLIIEKLLIIHRSLKKDFRIRKPRIAVLGLNPHAGEHGLLGVEEQNIIIPSIKKAQRLYLSVDGPFPADGFFGMQKQKDFDLVLCMYHDQGLIPLKISGFRIGVNYSAGLPIVRTSPDHGTAFEIAGEGIADPRSMIEAIKLAVTIIHNRKR